MSDAGYPTTEALYEAETNGFVCAVIARENGPKQTLFCWVVGPFATQREAANAAATVRRRYRARGMHAPSSLVKASVRPLWKEVGR